MGSGNSKPTGDITEHVFSADAPVRLSGTLVDSLQKNTHTDSVRAKQHELQYQLRLTSELEKLRNQEAEKLAKLYDTVSSEPEEPPEPSLAEKLSDATSSSATLSEKQRQKDMSRDVVTKEIEALKKKLEARKKLEQVDPALNKAKEDVITCLRLNDRRPLDCWQEVETFKREVGRLEKEFVERTIR
ncbi:uncharacterized protein EI97DRAFT_374995 [Westerdykella ornata]|uniref:DUF1690-domain-containing protein n=1 Tax=Westerdykella ornata TaxID=318751 RepID=A0A6A6JPL1_WESOR|nr:uncharacterized protein EI97DRAFT_374995 [Westerdykella ornata]KAF2277616.1 hypothetical protein EI97DRAFT_374995 [Westerdykella ornata]